MSINDNLRKNFSQLESLDILNSGLKILLIMKLLSFEDLDDHIISEDKKFTGLQPIVFKNGLN